MQTSHEKQSQDEDVGPLTRNSGVSPPSPVVSPWTSSGCPAQDPKLHLTPKCLMGLRHDGLPPASAEGEKA